MGQTKRHTLGVLTNDHPGVLQRVAGLFGRRGYNIESITVGASEEEGVSRMTIVAVGEERIRDQIILQLGKLIDVIGVTALDDGPLLARELMLVRLEAAPGKRAEIIALAESFRCAVADVGPDTLIVQAVGDVAKNDALLRLFRPYGILELTRTGETAMSRSRGAQESCEDG
ncbi:acetolactate synthase small subunit [Gorillibacterium sp. sgz5001074]|uniref:acetolactate synthase small subunit n=1 Tax=Gorillibacterium sp. sgz5001074 TaxID=3446695 RepID=UPI003F67CBD0